MSGLFVNEAPGACALVVRDLEEWRIRMSRFGEQRLVRKDVGFAHRAIFRLLGVAEPAHYLHHKYLHRALDCVNGLYPTEILDAGCGSGDHTFSLARRFPRARVLGIDVDEALIERNRDVARALRLSNVAFEVASVTEQIRRTFDVIVSIDVLEHLMEQQRALRCLRAALAPGGIAFFHIPTVRPRPVPCSRWLTDFHAWAEREHVAQDVTPAEFVRAVEDAGFRVIASWPTFGYWSGELATSLFALPFRNTWSNRGFQLALAPFCRLLITMDHVGSQQMRYAIALLLRG
jgi:2-polyprenyl-3-methyl-5-hydroxy-6-metoxy-1,4-benzoquinol methylase